MAPGCVETNEGVPWPIADGDSFAWIWGSVDGQGELALDVHVNRAGIEGDRQRASRFEDG